jgi:magnesium transporter
MKIQVSRRGVKTGAPPGTLMHIGRDRTNGIIITRCIYDENNFFEEKNITPDKLFTSKDEGSIEWVNFDGIHDVKLIEEIGRHYSIDMLVLEDIVNATQRPKIEDYNDYIHVVLKMLTYNNLTSEIESEQVSFVFNSRIVLTFQEKNTDDFDTVRDRIRKKGKIRRMGTDYLVYSLLDYIIDNYFLVLEKTGEKIELLEDEVFASSSRETIKKIHELKREISQ